ncbi:MAG: murein hydrolase activator EnvC family protein [Solirubrobacteraceae bacterium]
MAALPLALWAALPLVSTGQSPNELERKIDRTRDKIQWRRGRERVLTTEVSAYTRRIGGLQSEITTLQGRQVRLQASLDAKRIELARIQERLRQERARLARLRARLAEAKVALADRLVELYKADKPDLVTVVLEADGFADLLSRTEFMQRVSSQDARIVARVRDAKAEATATAERLDRLEKRAEEVAEAIEVEVQEVAAVKGQLVERRDRYAEARAGKAELLANTRADRHELEDHVHALEREQAAVMARLQQSSGGGGGVAGPIRQGSGSLIWPASGSISSGFGMRWGRLHAGIDIPLPEGTGLRAADGGRVVVAGPMGGYGNYICIQHGGALSTCYGHLSSIGVSVGQSVSQGQVIGASGNTGNSTGPHLHFETRVNGNPVDPLGYL